MTTDEIMALAERMAYGGTSPDAAEFELFRAAIEALQADARRVYKAAQDVTTEAEDKIDYFRVPARFMAALALALDETMALDKS
jgi:hypothetical protein